MKNFSRSKIRPPSEEICTGTRTEGRRADRGCCIAEAVLKEIIVIFEVVVILSIELYVDVDVLL